MQYQYRKEKPLPVGSNGRTPEIIFANWREMLHGSSIQEVLQRDYERGVEEYLKYCTLKGESVTTQTARNFMSDAHRRGMDPGKRL